MLLVNVIKFRIHLYYLLSEWVVKLRQRCVDEVRLEAER